MTIENWLNEAIKKLTEAQVDTPRLDCLVLLEHALVLPRATILAHDELALSKQQITQLDERLEKRIEHVPIAYIVGHKEFYGLNFIVNESVLVPRPETEDLVEYAVKHSPRNAHAIELGTGSGAIAVALAHLRPDLDIVATDISTDALSVARTNARTNKVQIEFCESDLFKNVDGHYDVMLANLPYVPIEARRQRDIEFEPDIALYSGVDGLDLYRTFFSQATQYLKPEGTVVVEFSPTQHAAVAAIAQTNGFSLEPISEYIYVAKVL